MFKNLLRISIISLSCLLVSCSASKNGGAGSAVNNSSTNMGTTNTGNALQPLELISGPGAAPVTGSDGTMLASTFKFIATYSAPYDGTIGSGYCLYSNYSGQSYCINNACTLQSDPNLGIDPNTGTSYNMCAKDACMTDAAALDGTISIAADASTNPAPSGQCVAYEAVYFLKITLYANYNREYFVSPNPLPMAASGSAYNSCLGSVGFFTVSSFTDMGSLASPADTGNGALNFFCAEYPSNPNMGSFVIQYCKDPVSCSTD